jgi:hypothetical protein
LYRLGGSSSASSWYSLLALVYRMISAGGRFRRRRGAAGRLYRHNPVLPHGWIDR